MGRYRSRSRSYSPRRSPTPPLPPRRKRYDDPRDRHRSSRSSYRDRRPSGPSGLLVRNIALDARPEDLRVPFERFGPVKDVYLPRNYYTGEPRGFGFVKFHNADDAAEAKERMNRQMIGGREIRIVFAEENRKTPQEMRMTARISDRYRRRSPPRSPRRRYHSYSRSPSPVWRGSRERSGGSRKEYYSPRRSVSRSRSPRRARSISRSPSMPRRSISRSPPRRRTISKSPSPRRRKSISRSPSLRKGRLSSMSPPQGRMSISRSPPPRGRSISRTPSPRERSIPRTLPPQSGRSSSRSPPPKGRSISMTPPMRARSMTMPSPRERSIPRSPEGGRALVRSPGRRFSRSLSPRGRRSISNSHSPREYYKEEYDTRENGRNNLRSRSSSPCR